MPNNIAVSYGQSSLPSYPNPQYFLGNFSIDPVTTSPGQWWYNTTTMQIKGNINGSVQILSAFAGSFSATTFITQNTTIGGQGVTDNYVDLVITNNATLTILAGSNVNVAGVLNVTAGASLVLQGATLNVYNALQNAGTIQSTSASDSIQGVQVQNTGVMQIDGTLYLPSAGYNHMLGGTISGTGTLNIQGTAITLIGDQLSLSISTVNGSGSYQIQQNGVCTINGNIAMSLANVTGTGTVSIPSGNTLTFSGSNLTPSTLTVSGTLALSGNYTMPTNITVPTGTGTLSIASTYTLTIGANATLSISSFSNSGTLSINSGVTLTLNNSYSSGILAGSGTISIGSSYTLTVNASSTNSLSFAGVGTLSIASGITLITNGNVTYSIATVSGAGTLSVASGVTLTVGGNVTFSVATVNGAGGLTIGSGYTLTFSGSNLLPSTINVSGILALSGNYTMPTNITVPTGSGTLTINSGYTLTQGAAITLSVSTINIAGTWANAGYGITIPSGSTVSWNVTGSITTASTAGTLTVNGTSYWIGSGFTTYFSGIGGSAESSLYPTFVLALAGTGVFIGAPAGKQNSTISITLSADAIATNGLSSGNATDFGHLTPWINLTAVKGSAVGEYGIGEYSSDGPGPWELFILIYIGTANTSYTVSGNFGYTNANINAYNYAVRNSTYSAGTITLTGTAYV